MIDVVGRDFELTDDILVGRNKQLFFLATSMTMPLEQIMSFPKTMPQPRSRTTRNLIVTFAKRFYHDYFPCVIDSLVAIFEVNSIIQKDPICRENLATRSSSMNDIPQILLCRQSRINT